MIALRRLSLLVLALCVLAACSSDGDAKKVKGTRISVLQDIHKTQVDPGLQGFAFNLPDPALNADWPQAGANTRHEQPNAVLSPMPERDWSRSIGSGSTSDFKLLSAPVVAGGMVYAMDSRGRVSAYDLKNGSREWRTETMPKDHDGDAMGGGVAYEDGVVYATTGFGEVLALQARSGAIVWRRPLLKPIRSAPTVGDGRVFVTNIENETHALDARTGTPLWKHAGLAENTSIMGMASPALSGDMVVVAYSSGEVFGLRAQNGRVLWGEVLAVPTQLGALPAIADVRGHPVLSDRRAYAISHSGRMAAIDQRTGDRVWEADIGGLNTPLVLGDVIYVLSNKNELIALDRANGRVVWLTQLARLEDPDNRSSKAIAWFGPVMAGGRLWVTSSRGHLAAYEPDTGTSVFEDRAARSFFLPPIVADRTMLLLSDDGDLLAYR